ncbi:ABC transporter permease [Niallia sp. Krafla_26]|uniref:ABC transporter permease n=1 Tax=Niallia sp. Krafla_26 TaxID=3064703 RepID=UPI003D17A86D
MFDEKLLWKERFSRTNRELSRYLRYILNGHLVIVFIFLLGTAAYYYQEWLKSLPADFPAAPIMAVLMALLVTYSPIYTFMSDADRIFLLPLETKLQGYFKKSILISFFVGVYVLLVVLAVLMPMYAAVHNGQFKDFWIFLLIVLGAKAINLWIRWFVQYDNEVRNHRIDSAIRFFVNLVFLYLLFSNAKPYLIAVPAVLLVGLLLYYRQQSQNKGLKWEYLIEQDERRMTAFYQLANLFTDVPKLKNKIKRRKALDNLLTRIPFQQDHTYIYLLGRTFLRSGDYLGLFIRLTIIAGVAIYFLTFGIGQVILVVLFLYLTGFQLLPLWKHHQNHFMLELLPISNRIKHETFLRMIRNILGLQALLLSAVVFVKGDWMSAIISLLAGIVFCLYFVYMYSKRKISE